MPKARCPYCHDDLPDDAQTAVECTGCGARHHAECFVECSGCAVFACRTQRALLGERDLDLEAIHSWLRGRELEAARPEQAPLDLTAILMTVVFLATGTLIGGLLGGPWVGLLGLLVGGVLAGVLVHQRPEPVQHLDDPQVYLRQAETFHPETAPLSEPPHLVVLRRLQAGGPQRSPNALPEGPPPESCPHCQASLTVDDPEADGAMWFCYHCGRELVDHESNWIGRLKA